MTAMQDEARDDDQQWAACQAAWQLPGDTVYLNHGSFGLSPQPVRSAYRAWTDRLQQQPMDFYVRHFEPAWRAARRQLAQFVGTADQNLVFMENATHGMNHVAANFRLRPGDEVVLTDHEYGAVKRIWQRACQQAGASPPRLASLPRPLESPQQVLQAIFSLVTDRTRLLVISHVTSPTALVLPITDICRQARQRGVAVCVDGPHAPLQVPLAIDALDCDFYTASCHKWLSAPLGSGFLYVHPRHQQGFLPLVLSWGRLPPRSLDQWCDEFIWSGTRDPSAYLSIPAATEFFTELGCERFRRRTHALADDARRQLEDWSGQTSWASDPQFFGSMVNVPLPPGDHSQLQANLWQKHGIEVPIIDFLGQWSIRVSCHVYTQVEDIERLMAALRET